VKTHNSIDLTEISDKCFAALQHEEGCTVLIAPEDRCGTIGCPFYKPEGLKDWVRITDKDGTFILPPEEHREL